MMAARRVVVLRDVEGWKRKPKTRAAFLKYLERPAAETVVVLVQSSADAEPDRDLVRGAFAVECEPLAPDRARRWLLRRATRLGVTLEDAAADHLLAATGGELAAVAAELEKLSCAPGRGATHRGAGGVRWSACVMARPCTIGGMPCWMGPPAAPRACWAHCSISRASRRSA